MRTGDDAVDDVAADADPLVVVDDLLDAVVALGLDGARDACHVALDLSFAVEHAVVRVHPRALVVSTIPFRERGRRTVAGDNQPLDRARLPLARRAHNAASRAHCRLTMLVLREAVGGDAAVVAGAVDRHLGGCEKRGATVPRFLVLR
jgi:hypothetical protein